MLHAVIPAGGSGTRLWPLSRAGNPKFLHPLTGTAQTLLQATVSRLEHICPLSDIMVVTGVAHAAAVARQLPDLPERNIVVEPSPRDSCAAIGLAAALIARQDPQAIMGSFPGDHLVRDTSRLVEVLEQAAAGAKQGLLMTVGITPTHPETGYGYLECGEGLDWPVRRVDQFKEKPSHAVATQYLESGRYLWNAGMFVWRVDVFLAELQRQQPSLHDGLMRIVAAWDTDRDTVMGEIWPTLTKISIDYAVMEGAAAAGLVATVPGDFGWTDVGDFHAVAEALPADEFGNVLVGDDKSDVVLHDVTGSIIVPQSGRLVAALGVSEIIVVDTPDAVLVCRRDRAQDVKHLVDELKNRGDHRV
ncbi:mannose-1-phosphate guanyltransferase [Rhizocola hellebori]|uniref:mannose-1-phosphate guanylyltransferase n=1 Tax=Rhizocola hellebori TaxID=1392758 RepID=A0A8J3VK21_9ACTN|nr:sugar phosphate nucleotidyltransferase [Rhizocola hellebori]GIH08651.1 mannose-1-phosphate guanyltransferase [Rhizocola hellebori]